MSLSTSTSPASAPSRIAAAAARFSSMTGEGSTRRSRSYRATISAQSVASAVGALACTAAIAACSAYGPKRRDANTRSTRRRPSSIIALSHSARSCSSSRMISPDGAARAAPRLLQQHQREQPYRLGLGQQLDEQTAEPDRLLRQIAAGQGLARRREVALVEHEIDDAQHAVEPLVERVTGRHLIRDAVGLDLALRAHDALRERRGRDQERMRDLLRREIADLAQRQGDLRILRQRRVTAREDQTQTVVLGPLPVEVRREGLLGAAMQALGDVGLGRIEALAAADRVDCLEPPGRDEPGARVIRHALARPLLDGGPKRLVQRFLGEIEVAEEPDQRREHAPR